MEEKDGEVERLKSLLLQDTPIWIDGLDFFAFNFGDESQKHPMAGSDSKISSKSGSAVIDRKTGEWRFTEPHMPIVNVSHVPQFDHIKVNVAFDEVRKAIEKK
ncbi:MAG: hypothetical protein HYT12_04635 [Candidatus Liptonbacteria bacterium]|nr:hypothetical protein [Candidatus Liptonbacteria bacterium]